MADCRRQVMRERLQISAGLSLTEFPWYYTVKAIYRFVYKSSRTVAALEGSGLLSDRKKGKVKIKIWVSK